MLDTTYDVPSRADIKEAVVNEDVITKRALAGGVRATERW
jgi:hypothetical protein